MRAFLAFSALLIWILPLSAQHSFSIELEEFNITQAPGLQSFVVGTNEAGEWLLLGGRIDGLHLRRPFESFLASGNNTSIYVIDPYEDSVWSAPLSSLPTSLEEQLQSTNMEFIQREDMLYIIGGYAYSTSAGDHITFPYLTAIDVPALIEAIKKEEPITSHIRQIQDARIQVTGGYLGYLDSVFYLVGGQKFTGRYNPMGPSHGPGFVQEYTNAIRTFKIPDNGSLAITDFQETVDTANLHRRDYNMAPQIFPDGAKGFTAFSGVFQHQVDLPWLNTVDITPSGYTVRPNFNQYLSQYHSAHLPVFDASANEMHTIFFGGMSRYTYDPNTNQLVDDQQVPFVKTVSQITRFANDSMVEYELPVQMPGFLGASAEFIPEVAAPYTFGEVLDAGALSPGKHLVGYIFGGIESSQDNIFFINDGTQSWPSTRVFRVYLDNTTTGTEALKPLTGESIFAVTLNPNPADSQVKVTFGIPAPMDIQLHIANMHGQLLKGLDFGRLIKGTYEYEVDTSFLARGTYLLIVTDGVYRKTVRLVIQ